MELEESLPTFHEQGLGVVAISYDEPEVIRHFAERKGGFSYPLLADPRSEIIGAFGIANGNFEEGSPGYGIAFPGTFVVDANGVVTGKYFEAMHRQRYTARTVLVETLGVGGGRRIEVSTPQLELAAYASQDEVRPGNRIALTVEISLPEGMHLYAPGADPYRGVELRIADHPRLQVGETSLPEPERVFLPAIDETVPVYRGGVTLRREITLSPRFRGEKLDVEAVVPYQTCDEEECYLPAEQPLTFELTVLPHDGERVPEALRRGED